MNKFLSKIVLPFIAVSSLMATQSVEQKVVYDHRVTIHPNHYAYEYAPQNDLYLSFDAHASNGYTTDDISTTVLSGDVKIGHNFALDCGTSIRPFIGGGLYRDLSATYSWAWEKETQNYQTQYSTHGPILAYGAFGVGFEHPITRLFTVGLTAKAFGGGIAGKSYGREKKFYYGADIALPVSVHFGNAYRWQLRLEPFTLVINDGTRYLGHRSAIAYRF